MAVRGIPGEGSDWRSTSTQETPALPSVTAMASPTGPPPTIATEALTLRGPLIAEATSQVSGAGWYI
jgi:hypothetical protein